MADKKITELTQIDTISSGDVFPIVDISDNITKKIDITQIKAQSPVQSVNSNIGAVVLTKTDIGLSNVDNTSDANKPVSTATQTALDGKVDENATITGATKTKITYDAKGLVTSGADATTADIADSTNKRYVTDAQATVIGNTSGTNTGDNATNSQYSGLAASKQDALTLTTTGTSGAATLVGATLNIPQYSGGGGTTWGSITGTLSSQTDLQTALDSKVDENAAITGATKTKITYDAKGLVTAGADATTADIADSTNKRYVTDANLTVIGNTSGTNTGDNATNSQYSGLATSKQDTLVSGTNIKTINSTTLLGSGNITTGTVTSVGVSMPSAFSVASSPVTTSGTIAVTGAGLTSQYVRGDGSLANFPTSGGGGASVNYYLNGSVSQGTFGGVAMREINKVPIIGTGTDFTIATNGYIQSFITDANDPNQLSIPAGNWNFETYMSASSNGGSPSFYIELHKWDGTTLTLIATSSATPEAITGGTAIDLYTTALAVPQTTLALTDRLAIRIYVTNSGRTITLHTENSHLCQVITTFTTGLTALNGLTEQVQTFAVGTTGTDFGISSASGIHNFNLPTASASNRGALSSADWSTFNDKANKLITTNRQTASYTLVIGDADKLVEMNVATANNLTIPLNSSVAFATGTQILLAQYGAGQTTVVATSGVTIRSSGGKLKLNAQYSGASLIKIGSDEWYLFGDIAA